MTQIPESWLMYAELKGDSSDELRKYTREQIQKFANKLGLFLTRIDRAIEGSEYFNQQMTEYLKFDWMLSALKVQKTVYAVQAKQLI